MRLAPLLAVLACSRGPLGPAPLDTRNEACAHCRMAVSDARFAAQPILMVDQYATRALYGSTLDHVPYTSDIGSYFFPYELVPAH